MGLCFFLFVKEKDATIDNPVLPEKVLFFFSDLCSLRVFIVISVDSLDRFLLIKTQVTHSQLILSFYSIETGIQSQKLLDLPHLTNT